MDLDPQPDSEGFASLGPLSLIPTAELIEEIKARYDAVVVLYLQDCDRDLELMQTTWSGGRYTCLGMAREYARLLESRADVRMGQHDIEDL